MRSREKGVVLVGVLALMLIAGLFIAALSSLVFVAVGSQANILGGAQALAITQAGSEWYFETLRTDTNWANETNQTRSFAGGSFDITILSASATQVQFRSTGTSPASLNGVNFRRTETWTVRKLPMAFKFALYQGSDPGPNFELRSNGGNNTVVNGNVWSLGSVDVNSGNQVLNGKVFVPTTENVTGTGTFTRKLIAAPNPAMPVLNAASYTTPMNGFNTLLNNNTSNVNQVVNNTTFTVNGTMNFRTFRTTGTSTIQGSGTIVSQNSLLLHGNNGLGAGTRLTITPTAGGSITFITNGDLTIGSNNNNPQITNSGTCVFYARSSGSNNEMLNIRGSSVNISGTFLAQRRILVEQGADVSGVSTLFVNNAGSTNNNVIDIVGSNGVTSITGNLLSLSARNSAIEIRNGGNNKQNVQVNGLVYARAGASTGSCNISDATINGSVVCNAYQNNRVTNTAITYQDVSTNVPAGFDNTISKQDNAWDGL